MPIVRIDEAMASRSSQTVRPHRRDSHAALDLEPTLRLLQDQAQQLGRDITLVDGLAKGAYDALVNGSPQQHDQLILDTAIRSETAGRRLCLAQGSMARMERNLADATGLPVFSSPRLGVEAVKQALSETAS